MSETGYINQTMIVFFRFQFLLSLSVLFFVGEQNMLSQAHNQNSLQVLRADFDKLYGVDFDLVNGRKYINFYGNAIGHAFLDSKEFKQGWIEIKSQKHTGLKVNYDIYNQLLITEFDSELIGTQRYMPPLMYLQSFGIESRVFKKMTFKNTPERYFEVISEGRYTVLFTHDKNYSVSTDLNSQKFRFSDDILKMYMVVDDGLVRFKSNSSFRKLFPEEIQDEVKGLMKMYRINVKHSGIDNLKHLMELINQL